MNISSVLVNALPQALPQVIAGLSALVGVEVHARTENGRLVVTIEADSEQATSQIFAEIQQHPGVLSVAMVYHRFEPYPDEEA